MNDSDDRRAILREIAKKRVVHQIPGMESLPVRTDLTFSSDCGIELPMDLYYPARVHDQPVPVVILATAYPDPTGWMRRFGPITSWAQLFAGSGMAAVVYGTDEPSENALAVLRQLRATSDALHLDPVRFGVFAFSAHVTVALATLMRGNLACGAFLYGYTMDLDGATAVADASRQFGFVNACAGKSPEDLPMHVPMLFVRAGQDQTALNAGLDNLIARALGRNLPVSVVNHASGAHGFDVDENTRLSRGVIMQVLSFLRLHLMA
jgi:dienelactone hydrolase